MGHHDSIQELVSNWIGSNTRIASMSPLGGGCINVANRMELDDGRAFFVKTNSNAASELFESEARGLQELANTNTVRVPNVIGFGSTGDGTQIIVLELIESGRQGSNYFETLGHQLAQLHMANSKSESPISSFGFDIDNFIGSTPQPNICCSDWIAFWREHRLGFQVALAFDQGLLSSELRNCFDRMAERLDVLIGTTNEVPSLIHGDLWSGNYMTGERGEPVLIDPAAYYGHREAEFGMIALFGGLGDDFFAAYNETWPLHQDGLQDRIEIYKLYHLLNHLNLFGSSYLSGCASILRRFGR